MNLKKRLKRRVVILLACTSLTFSQSSYAIWGDGGAGWAQIPYLVKILAENYKRYKQLQSMMDQSRFHRDWLRTVHAGLENAAHLIESLPVKDEKILSQLRTFDRSIKTIEQIYGVIPNSKEQALHRLHDNTVAESLRMIHDFQKYAEKQEANSVILSANSRAASPKGAARIAATTNAEVLRSLSQLIRLNSQMLKLQGEQLALKNKTGKNRVASFQRINSDLGSGFQSFNPSMNLPRF